MIQRGLSQNAGNMGKFLTAFSGSSHSCWVVSRFPCVALSQKNFNVLNFMLAHESKEQVPVLVWNRLRPPLSVSLVVDHIHVYQAIEK